MAIRALETMVGDGRAAIIIGGHTKWDAKGRIQAGKNRLFFNFLYHHYHVIDVIQINGAKPVSYTHLDVYKRQYPKWTQTKLHHK